MDLKSMLNDSASQRPPRLHTPQSSYDARTDQTPSTEHSSARPTPYAPPLQPVDSRAQSSGSYFAIQSPSQNNSASASTPSVGTHSAYAQSPGGYPQSFTPRESAPPSHIHNHNAPLSSPSPSLHHPLTPSAAQHQQYPHAAHYGHPTQAPGHPQYHSPVLTAGYGRPVAQISHSSNSPATPLGPPMTHMKVSPQAQRPTSQGQDQHYRRTSYSSVGSAHSRDHNYASGPIPEPVRRESVHQPYLTEMRERERSISVSPKTIPKPSPYRNSSSASQQNNNTRPPTLLHQESTPVTPGTLSDRQYDSPPPATSIDQKAFSTAQSAKRSPAAPSAVATQNSRPNHEQLPTQIGSPTEISSSLKRNASHLSDGQVQVQPPRKKLRRNEVPIWAHNARKKPLRLGRTNAGTTSSMVKQIQQTPQPQQVQQTPQPQPQLMQQRTQQRASPATNGDSTPGQATEPAGLKWEASIADICPYEDLTRQICDWIVATIGFAEPPPGGAAFEIEAKIGEIVDVDSLERIDIPIRSEAIFSREKSNRSGRRTKFRSSMNQLQHKALNEYLNGLVRDVMLERQQGQPRHEILYAHPKENDEFFELSEEGKRNLPPHMLQYIFADTNRHQRNSVRIRRTVNKMTGRVEAQIIKTRIADVDIYNPQSDFDYRISISIESPWEGDERWLSPMSDGNAGRHKDRMSYRHMMYQIDLTQVSYENKADLEHELEVEIATEQIRKELENLRAGNPTRYEDMIRGLVDNVRLLCRKGTTSKSAAHH